MCNQKEVMTIKVFEVVLLLSAIAAVCTYLFYRADFLVYTALAGGIGYSVIHLIRTYERRKNAVLGHPDAKYYNTFDSYDDDYVTGDLFDDISDHDGF